MNWLTLLVLFLSVSLATGDWPYMRLGSKHQTQSPVTNAELAKKSVKGSFYKRSVDDVHRNSKDRIKYPGEGLFSFNFLY